MKDKEEKELHELAVILEMLTRGTGWEASRYEAIGRVVTKIAEYCKP